MKVKVFALDVGNKQVKLKSEKGDYTLPSYFVNYDEVGQAIDLVDVDSDIDKYSTKFDSDFEYAWGNGINELDNPTIIDTFTFDNRYTKHEFKLLTSFALAKLAEDFAESKDGVLDVEVVTGVPTNDFNEANVKSIFKHLKGLHEVSINDTSHKINVVNAHVIPQPHGTIYSKLMDNNGDITNNELRGENITVVDVGGGTILIDTLKKMKMDKTESTQTGKGIHELYERIVAVALSKGYKGLTRYRVEQILKNKTDHGYIYKPNKRGEAFNITDIVEKEIKRYTREVANTLQATVKDLTTKDRIIFTGGGSHILDRKYLSENFNYVEFADNPSRANCEGYYKFGLAVTKNDGEDNE